MNHSLQLCEPRGSRQSPGTLSAGAAPVSALRKHSRPGLWLALLTAMMAQLFSATLIHADQVPVGCNGSGLGINLFTSSPDVHIGDTLTYSVTVFNGLAGSGRVVCDATSIQAFIVTPDGVSHSVTLVRTTLHNGELDYYPDVVSYVVRAQDVRADATLRATASDTGVIHQNDTESQGGGDQGVNTEVSLPCIGLGVQCVGSIGETGALAFTGSVTNCGNNTLVGITVTNFVNGGQFNVTLIDELTVGQVARFSGTWIPTDPCSPSTATLVAQGVDQFTTRPRTVTSTATTTCEEVLTTGIKVTKVCPEGPVAPGQLLVYFGTVTNTGNVTLTNVVVLSDHPASTAVFTAASLAPGAGASFSGSYLAPVDCSTTSGLVARGTSVCGVTVTDSASSTCTIVTTPQISVATVCSAVTAVPGGVQTYTGTVQNTGDVPLKNVVVLSDRPVANTRVFAAATLAPGASANFTGTYTVPLLNACAVTTTVVATGHDLCTDRAVTSTTAVTCGVTTAPQIAVTLNCPAVTVMAGGLVTYTGTVSNPGNVTLLEVTVVDGQSTPATVLTMPSLAPGASANFTATFTAPADACAVGTTVNASGSDSCTSLVVTASKSATCPLVTTPLLAITQNCPTDPVAPGGLFTYSGTVRNAGDVTLTNVVVLNSRSGANPVFTAATLAPGSTATFTGNYIVPVDVCSVSSTSTVSATSVCGVAVSNSATSVCPLITSPLIAVTTVCSTNVVAPGGALAYSGTVRNGGNVTLNNVVVTSDRPVAGTILFTAATLAPGSSANFTGTYTAPATFSPGACAITATITATGKDLCTALAVTSTSTANCPITTAPQIAVTLNCPAVTAMAGGLVTYTGTVSNPGNVTLLNVTVVDGQSTPATVLTVPSLAPGASANFTVTFAAPADACAVGTTVNASGSDSCTSLVVTASKSVTCPLVTTPLLAITQNCPTDPVAPGGLFTYSGTVRNAGDVTLTNVLIFRNGSVSLPPDLEPTTAGLVGYWAFDASAGNLALDGSGLGNVGAINNAPDVAGVLGGALDFNGLNSSVIIPVNAGLNFTGPISLAAWIKPDSGDGRQNIMAHGYTLTPRRSVFLRITTNRYEVGSQKDNTAIYASAAMPEGDVGTFVHLAGVYNGSAWTIYRNGVALKTLASPVGAVAMDANWAIGARDGGLDRNFSGVIDEARLYNRALSTAEILVLAGQTQAPTLSGDSIPVFNVATLAPGETASFTGSYMLSPNGACSVTTTLTARGADKCTGVNVTAATTTTCPLVTAPAIEVTLVCPALPGVQGSLLSYSGTVKNIGNITLTNVVVINNRSGATPVLILASLAPGASANFTGTYRVPLNCCTVSSTATATGADACTGQAVADTATATCLVLSSPQIAVTKDCPVLPVMPGDLLRYKGTVSNTGNITLIDVVVVNNRSGIESPVFGPITLAPGESADYTAAYLVPADFCGADTVTVRGKSICEVSVTDSATTTCPIVTAPSISVTRNCPPLPTPRGGTYTYTGTVRNTGNVTLVDVFVVNTQPIENTAVLGPITLAPGASADFSSSFTAPVDCCEITDTVTARGRDLCGGIIVTAKASTVCPLLTTPQLAIAETCPTARVPVGGLFTFGGSLTNIGDVNLTNIMVFSTRSGGIRVMVLGPTELAPGEVAHFTGSYLVIAGTDPTTDIIEATGMDTCQARTVAARANCAGPVNPLGTSPVIRSVIIAAGVSTVVWDATPNVTYTLQCKGAVNDSIWIDIPGNVTANGSTASKADSVGPIAKRFYRVVAVE